ncbi:MAG: efflux RND transporter periplasmic adaptor subunit [Planctomycetes bacterium]|nr:efflux RND transporter periplasmic adaptor subunit [Planctomycetota bacterium]
MESNVRKSSIIKSVLRKVMAPLGACVFGLVVLFGLRMLPDRVKPEAKIEDPIVNVSVVEIKPVERLADTFTVECIVEPWATIRLSAETAGRIEKISAVEGDLIQPNQPLISLERDLLEAAFRQAKAKADFDAREYLRTEAANERNAVTQMEVDVVRSAAEVSKAAMDLAEAQLRRTIIRAPATVHDNNRGTNNPTKVLGVLDNLAVEVGEFVKSGDLVAEIVDSSVVKVMVDVPERDVRYIRPGQAVVVQADGAGEVVGTIHFIKTAADERTRTFRTEIKVPNPTGEIRPGMIVKVRLLRQELADVIMIPLDAVIPLESGYEVYVNADGKAERRQVSLGIIRGRMVQALPGATGESLRAGDRLIISGQRLVAEGQLIAEQPMAALAVPGEGGLVQVAEVEPSARVNGTGGNER